MQETSKYTELAMNHQWIALARLWLEDNAPCSREKMFVELGMLMPDTIRTSGISPIASKQSLVKMAYRKIYGTSNVTEVIERPPERKQGKKAQKGYTQIILNEAKKRSVKPSDFAEMKNRSTFFANLVKRGLLKRNDDGSYEAV